MSQIPEFMLWILIVAAIINILTLALLWREVFKPLASGVERLVALVGTLGKAMPDVTEALRNMESISHVTGISLRDAVMMLEEAVAETRIAARQDKQAGEVLRVNLHDDRLLARQDREQLEKLLLLLDRLGVQVQASGATGLRIERRAEGVASDLALAQAAVEGVATDLAVSQRVVSNVADDLAASHRRADETEGPHGAAADAAAGSSEEDRVERRNRSGEPSSDPRVEPKVERRKPNGGLDDS